MDPCSQELNPHWTPAENQNLYLSPNLEGFIQKHDSSLALKFMEIAPIKMSKPVENDESNTIQCDHDNPPQYDSCQQGPDLLTSAIENEMAFRRYGPKLVEFHKDFKRLAKEVRGWNFGEGGRGSIWRLFGRKRRFEKHHLIKMTEMSTKAISMIQELTDLVKERSTQNLDLYAAIAKLSGDELDRTYASIKRNGA